LQVAKNLKIAFLCLAPSLTYPTKPSTAAEVGLGECDTI
jgi:hypothetical protein